MKRNTRAALAFIMLAVLAAGSEAWAAPITVETTVIGGTRTLTLKSLSGTDLNSIALGTTGQAPFLSDVTDIQYDHAGYQVSAVLSNLYAFDGADFTCTSKIDSSALSLDFLTHPISLTDIAALPAPTWDLTGQIGTTLGALLGVPGTTVINATNVAAERIDRTLSGILTGAEDTLPIKVATGQSGAFTNPGPQATCDPSPASPTTRLLQAGTANSAIDLFTWITNSVNSAADDNPNGTITGSELVSTGQVTDAVMSEAVRSALSSAGVDLGTLDTLLNAGTVTMSDIYAVLVATVDAISSLVGQTGTYLSVPKLVVNVPNGTPSGTFRGTMTVTLVDL